jgi:hypothetical protein
MRTIIIGVDGRGITFHVNRKFAGAARTPAGANRLIKRIALNENADVIMLSSSVDFPDEYTNNKTVLKMARKLRA